MSCLRINDFLNGSFFTIKFSIFAKQFESRIDFETKNFSFLLNPKSESRLETSHETSRMRTDSLIDNGDDAVLQMRLQLSIGIDF